MHKLLLSMLFVTASIAWVVEPAAAAIETNPSALYAALTEAYNEGSAHAWNYDAQKYYEEVAFATGRSYSLFSKEHPNYAQVAAVTVDTASAMHYDPLSNADASLWWVREAALYVRDHDVSRKAAALALLGRLDEAESSDAAAARIADADATANVENFHRESTARIDQVIVDLRAAMFSHDRSYDLLALHRAAQPDFPLIELPTRPSQQLFTFAQSVEDHPADFNGEDTAAAASLLKRRADTPDLQVIARVTALSHTLHLSITAPADEYFGRNGSSVLGMHNEMTHIAKYLDAGYGARMDAAGERLCEELLDLQHTYPRDYELPELLLRAQELIRRIPTNAAVDAAQTLHHVLIYNYPDSTQAQDGDVSRAQSEDPNAAQGAQ